MEEYNGNKNYETWDVITILCNTEKIYNRIFDINREIKEPWDAVRVVFWILRNFPERIDNVNYDQYSIVDWAAVAEKFNDMRRIE